MTRSATDIRLRFVRLPSGPTLRCAEAGAVDGEPVLFLHGYSDHWRSATPFLAFLPPSLRVIAPDQRGHGGSDRSASRYDVAALAADAAALLDALGIERATVVGHSMGSLAAQRLAVEHPERVTRLMLVGSGASLVENAALREFTAGVRALADPVPRSFVEQFQADSTHRPIPAEFVDAIVTEGCRMPARVWKEIASALERFDGRADLPRITAPTRIVWGDRDAFFGRADQEQLLAGIPDAALRVYAETGHAPNWEEPERFANELAAFVAAPNPAALPS
jgi:pimeloyl-ACP methyl ester carboxylesterase